MSDNRKRCSGAQYAKLRAQKQQRLEDEVKKTRNIATYFCSLSSAKAAEESGVPVPVEVPASSAESSDTLIADASDNNVSITSNSTALVKQTLTLNSDPAEWKVSDTTIDFLLKRGIEQNINFDFSETKKEYPDKKYRSLQKAVFFRKLSNGETVLRSYLVYSPSKKCLFCAPCLLFGGINVLTSGYSDWKNVNRVLGLHENSLEHKKCEITLIRRKNVLGRIDMKLQVQAETEVTYWKNVLRRVVAVIKKLGGRGLPFRGAEEKFGSNNNGNFMMCLELIAEFDPFLSSHIAKHGNPGRGKTSYLSSTICNEFIELMWKKVMAIIISEIKTAKYFSVIVDSTPDISHIDQLSFIVRYVNKEGIPIERFIGFIPNTGHKSQELANAVCDKLNELDIDINNCRGQSYDNASNMAGAYTGLQARLKELNSNIVFVPCAAHSLNLVGVSAAECCLDATAFFNIVQHIFTFFSASTRRWNILEEKIQEIKNSNLTIKGLSQTRWSARADAVGSLKKNWSAVIQALTSITQDLAEKPATRSEANGLKNNLQKPTSIILLNLWAVILERFEVSSQKLQNVNTSIKDVVHIYESLIEFLNTQRNQFDFYKEQSIIMTGQDDFSFDVSSKRPVKRTIHFDENLENETLFTPEMKFKVDTFFFIIDKLMAELQRRKEAYKCIYDRFELVCNFRIDNDIEIIKKLTQNLFENYGGDLEDTLFQEIMHVIEYIKTDDITKNKSSLSPMELYTLLKTNNLEVVFPNVEIILRIFLSMAVTNCSAERSFSVLKRIKNYMRSTVSNEHLNAFAVFAIENGTLNELDFEELIAEFAHTKSRRKML